MKFQIMSFSKLEKAEFKDSTVAISISVDQTHPNIFSKKNLLQFLCLTFADRDSGSEIMTKEQAKDILKFVEIHKDKHLIVCQCDAGISRSSAVAAALSKIYFDDDTWVFNDKQYRPNMHVYRTILKCAGLT
jgi:predicted protein tyrosine phosphatase